MKHITRKIRTNGGVTLRCKMDMQRLLNLNHLRYTNNTFCEGKLGLPALSCNTDILPNYLALYNEPSDYHKTDRTAVCFYLYDSVFDGQNGLFSAIYWGNQKQLEAFKERFKGVSFLLPRIILCWENYRKRKTIIVCIKRELSLRGS